MFYHRFKMTCQTATKKETVDKVYNKMKLMIKIWKTFNINDLLILTSVQNRQE